MTVTQRSASASNPPTLINSTREWGVSRSWRYCSARPTRDETEVSSRTSSPYKNQFNIEGDTWSPYQILS